MYVVVTRVKHALISASMQTLSYHGCFISPALLEKANEFI